MFLKKKILAIFQTSFVENKAVLKRGVDFEDIISRKNSFRYLAGIFKGFVRNPSVSSGIFPEKISLQF